MLSKFVITFLPRIKHLLILWLQSLSAVILEPKNPDRSVFTYDSTVHVLAELGRAVVHIREVDADSGHSAEGRRPAVFRFHHQVKLAA